MPYYRLGRVIRQRREQLGYTQEELSDGICSVPTLSRIENGTRVPSKEVFELLLQRIGYADTMQDIFVDEKTILIHELKFKIRQSLIEHMYSESATLLQEYCSLVQNPTKIEKQFIDITQILTETGTISAETKLQRLEAAIKLTVPTYSQDYFPRILSFEEIIIYNSIAGCKYAMGAVDEAINILYSLKKFYEGKGMNSEEVLRTQPLILYNLSKLLGSAERYSECIAICDLGIDIARKTGRCLFLANTLYNRAWALVHRNGPGDTESAAAFAKLAFQMATVMANKPLINHFQQFFHAYFPNKTLE